MRPPIWGTGLVALGWALVGWKTWAWPGRHGKPAYAYHMFFWMLPVVVMQWVLGPDILGPRLPLIAVVVGVVGSYLTVADILAVRWGLWFFDDRQVMGPRLFGVLPWEEAVFFFLTSLLVIQSLLLWRVALQ
jgi:lycopene cyclase domain-containing protein